MFLSYEQNTDLGTCWISVQPRINLLAQDPAERIDSIAVFA